MAVNGNSVLFALGKESLYAENVQPTDRLEVFSENFKYTANKTPEDLLTGRIGGGLVETMSLKTEGSFSTLAKPSSVGHVLKGVFGAESVAEQDPEKLKYNHTFVPIGNKESDKLPSYTFTIDRGLTQAFTYNGAIYDSVSFSAAAEDRLKLDVSLIGKMEGKGSTPSGLSIANERSFKFHQGKIAIDSTPIADITSIGFEYKNNITNYQTTDTGLYFSLPTPGRRECTATLETIYTDKIEAIREGKFKTDAVISIAVSFIDDDKNELVFTIPNAQIQSMDNATATGADTLKQSLTVQAVDISDTFVKVELKNNRAEEY